MPKSDAKRPFSPSAARPLGLHSHRRAALLRLPPPRVCRAQVAKDEKEAAHKSKLEEAARAKEEAARAKQAAADQKRLVLEQKAAEKERLAASRLANKEQKAAEKARRQAEGGGKAKKGRCGNCAGCRAADCGSCSACLDKPAFGGKGNKRQACKWRVCTTFQLRASEVVSTWLMCDRCEKWRIVPDLPGIVPADDDAPWYCEMNVDRARNHCDALQQPDEAELDPAVLRELQGAAEGGGGEDGADDEEAHADAADAPMPEAPVPDTPAPEAAAPPAAEPEEEEQGRKSKRKRGAR